MKYLILILSLATMIYSCECKKIKYRIGVVYTNGDKDTVGYTGNDCKSNTLFLNNGCIYTDYVESRYQANFQGCVVCGVRSFYRLNH